MIEAATLKHVHTYGMTVPAAVANLFCMDETASREQLERMVDSGLLGKAALTPSRDYYHLGDKAASALSVESVDTRLLTGNAKSTAYATLHFCCMEDVYRPLIPSGVFRTRFPELYRPGPRINYYTVGKTLGYLRVETRENTGGDIHRVIERVWRDVSRRRQWKNGSSPAFNSLLATNSFRVTLLTPFEAKATRLRKMLNRMDECHRLYNIRAKDIREHGENHYTQTPAYREYSQWHYKRKDRKPPRESPPMDIHVVPGLIDLIYPKPPPVA